MSLLLLFFFFFFFWSKCILIHQLVSYGLQINIFRRGWMGGPNDVTFTGLKEIRLIRIWIAPIRLLLLVFVVSEVV
jgi:hypothetical protein